MKFSDNNMLTRRIFVGTSIALAFAASAGSSTIPSDAFIPVDINMMTAKALLTLNYPGENDDKFSLSGLPEYFTGEIRQSGLPWV
jgi:hypothetical protein